MPTRAQVEAWKLEKLAEWASELEADTQEYENQLGRMLTHFTDATWSGAAHDAAADRFTEENDQGRRLSQEIRGTAAALRAADARLANERRILLGRVSDALNDPESPIPLTVDDRWTVAVTYLGAELPADDRQKVKDKVDHHQGLINAAYYSLMNAVNEVGAAIRAGAQQIRARGDLLGDGIDTPAATATDIAELGREDGRAVLAAIRPDGTVDPAILDQIASRLPQGVLSEQELHILAEGGEISTMPASTQQYYREFFQGAGKDGIVALTDHLESQDKAGNPAASAKLTALGNGLLAVSNEKVGTGKDANGRLQSPGGYEQLPKDLRDLVSRRWQDLDPNELAKPGQQAKDFRDLSSVGDLVSHASSGNQPGKIFGIELSRQGASMAEYLDANQKVRGDMLPGEGWQPGDKDRIENGARELFDTGLRNHESSAALLSGDLPADIPKPAGEDVRPGEIAYDRDKFASTVLNHDWGDDGKTPAKLFDWVATETHEVDSDGKPTEQAILARRTLIELPEFFAPVEGPQDPAQLGDKPDTHRSSNLVTKDGTTVFQSNAAVFAENPELSKALANVMGSNIDAYSERFGETGLTPKGLQPRLEGTDADRLLFLASQSDQGRLTLEVSRQAYEANVINQAFTNSDTNAGVQASESVRKIAGLDARLTAAAENAMTFQDEHKIGDYNDHQIELFEKKRAAAEIVAEMTIGQIEVPRQVPGGPIASMVADQLKESATEAAIEKFVPEPKELRQTFPDIANINAQGERDIQMQIISSALATGQDVPSALIDPTTRQPIDLNGTLEEYQIRARDEFFRDYNFTQFITDYTQSRTGILDAQTARDSTSLSVILTGQAPPQ
ncbi:TPR repeat region-containing protein [Nocardia abscessus]|uniref:TPR repeat region-containing protein n=1 Tax=Nocardia abscessus TaxID=120957 RepID=UPI0002FEAF64|nr:hypothetical protein [Nocardia abscessus]MCC3333404.1 hypothetical protein [Nocardia abscessus]